MRSTLVQLHLVLAIFAGVVIMSLGLTGSVMAFEPEIDHWQHRAMMDVTPAGEPHTLTEIRASVLTANAADRIGGITLGATPSRAYAVATQRGTIYVNPYTLQVTGVRPLGADWLANVHQMHLRLLTSWGRPLVRWSGVIMVFLLLSGLYLWWPVKRASVTFGRSPFRTWFDLHNAVGIFSLVFLLVLSLTGVFIGFSDVALPMAYAVTGSAPAQSVPAKLATIPGAHQISLDRALDAARGALPGAMPFYVPTVSPTDAYVVRARFPEDLTPGGRSRVTIDSYTGTVLGVENSRTAPAGRRVETMNRAIHTGDIFGLPSKILMSLASLMAPVQLVTGIMLWSRKKRGSRI